jgi:hypothetical protein
MFLQYLATEGVYLYLPCYLHPGTFEAKIEATDTGKQAAYFHFPPPPQSCCCFALRYSGSGQTTYFSILRFLGSGETPPSILSP